MGEEPEEHKRDGEGNAQECCEAVRRVVVCEMGGGLSTWVADEGWYVLSDVKDSMRQLELERDEQF